MLKYHLLLLVDHPFEVITTEKGAIAGKRSCRRSFAFTFVIFVWWPGAIISSNVRRVTTSCDSFSRFSQKSAVVIGQVFLSFRIYEQWERDWRLWKIYIDAERNVDRLRRFGWGWFRWFLPGACWSLVLVLVVLPQKYANRFKVCL